MMVYELCLWLTDILKFICSDLIQSKSKKEQARSPLFFPFIPPCYLKNYLLAMTGAVAEIIT